MPDRLRTPAPPPVDTLTASARVIQATQGTSTDRVFQYESWQQEAWGFLDSLGEFQYAIGWLSNAMSRVRLTAAELVPGGDEPAPLDEGPAADLVEQLGGGIAGHAAIMKSLAVQISVPGEGWLVAERADERIPLEQANWSVKSTEEIRPLRGQGGGYEVRVGETEWVSLGTESLPVRIWDPHPRWSWKATSPAKAAIPIMRTIELLNRRIIATLVSRLAMNGLLLIPQDGTINVPKQYQDEPDPFVAMLIDIAGKNIREPGAATASIPIPIKFASDEIEKWRHLTFGDGVDKELIDEREKELGRLATTVNIPAEVLKGIGATNHWVAWQLEESGIKLHISPVAETIVGGLTVGYLQPMLKALGADLVGPNGGKLIVWYDTSELTARPDKSEKALQAYDRVELSGAALRRESGLDESDVPTPEDERRQLLLKLVAAGSVEAYEALTGESLATPSQPARGAGPQSPVPGSPPTRGPGATGAGSPSPAPAATPGTGTRTAPPTRDNPPPAPGSDMPDGLAAAMAALHTRLGPVLSREVVGAGTGRRSPPARVNGHNGKSRDGPGKR
ncbi:hypothetical protein K1W54_04640 [Micromonospora sp. CPCC 205371]|nr:hypothetical protein [Micromonospora sp. CPCC 205371]